MTDELKEKIKTAEQTLKLAAEMSIYYYHQPLIICYSGGKDSDVLLNIARGCLKSNNFEVLNSHTTVDAPETVYHIRDVFKELEAEGIKTTVRVPKYNGKTTSMWRLIEVKHMPPTRLARYCCDVLKEQATPNRMIAVGVREDESAGRQGRDSFSTKGKTKNDAEFRSLQHTYAMFKLDKLNQETYECKMIEACKKNRDTICNPIYKFTDQDIWDYIKATGISINPLYSKGYKRIGCIGCPLAGRKQQLKEFADYPKYKENYIKAFGRMARKNAERKKAKGKPLTQYDTWTGEQFFRWWIGDDPNQLTFDDIISNEQES